MQMFFIWFLRRRSNTDYIDIRKELCHSDAFKLTLFSFATLSTYNKLKVDINFNSLNITYPTKILWNTKNIAIYKTFKVNSKRASTWHQQKWPNIRLSEKRNQLGYSHGAISA